MAKRGWQKISSNEIYRNGSFYWVTEDEVIQPDGKTTKYGVIHSRGAVFVVVLTTDNEYVFVQQARYPVGKDTIELVAGGMGDNSHDAVELARHEVQEETGAQAQDLELLGTLMSSPSRQDVPLHVVLAKGLDRSQIHLESQEGNEAINAVHAWPETEVVAKIRNGDISDAATIAALNLYWSKYGYPQTD